MKNSREFCEDYPSKAKAFIRGTNDPLLHKIMDDYATQIHTQRELLLARELDRVRQRIKTVVLNSPSRQTNDPFIMGFCQALVDNIDKTIEEQAK